METTTLGLGLGEADGLVGEHLVAVAEGDPQPGAGARPLGELDREGRLGVGDARTPRDVSDVLTRNRLEPDRLPDSARAVVPDDVPLLGPVLLAARLREVVRIVLDPHDDVEAGARIRHLRRERRVAALVMGDVLTADPDVGAVVDSPEVHAAGAGRAAWPAAAISSADDRAPVPHDVVESRVADARGRRLRREGHGDRSRVELRRGSPIRASRPSFSSSNSNSHVAAEIQPAGTDELGARVRPVLLARHGPRSFTHGRTIR